MKNGSVATVVALWHLPQRRTKNTANIPKPARMFFPHLERKPTLDPSGR
jgi:hypothetical protein